MKKNYEKEQLIFSFIFLFILIEILIISAFIKLEYRTYSIISSIIVTDNYTKSYVTESELKALQNSQNIYLDNKKYHYKIISIEKKVLKNKNNWYHEVIINFNIPKKYKDNDTIYISIYRKKEKVYRMLKTFWESDV